MNATTFFEICNEIARDLNCKFNARDYTKQYGWFGGSFVVDSFGGIAAIITHNINGWTLNSEPATISEIFAAIPGLVAAEFEARKGVDITEYNYD